MPTIYSSTNDGHIVKTSTADWTSARDATSGTAFDLIRFHSAITAAKAAGRGGSFIRVVVRSFFEFDTSGISIAPSSATLNQNNQQHLLIQILMLLRDGLQGLTMKEMLQNIHQK